MLDSTWISRWHEGGIWYDMRSTGTSLSYSSEVINLDMIYRYHISSILEYYKIKSRSHIKMISWSDICIIIISWCLDWRFLVSCDLRRKFWHETTTGRLETVACLNFHKKKIFFFFWNIISGKIQENLMYSTYNVCVASTMGQTNQWI